MSEEPEREEWSWVEKVNAERGRRRWTVTHLARRVQMDGMGPCDPLQLRRYLRGLHEPRDGLLARIAKVFGWPAEFLYRKDMPYGASEKRGRDWAAMVLRSLDEDGLRIVNAISDPAVREHLRRALDQYDAIRARFQPPPAASPESPPPRF